MIGTVNASVALAKYLKVSERKRNALGHDKLTNTNGSVRKSLNENGGIHDFMNNTK